MINVSNEMYERPVIMDSISSLCNFLEPKTTTTTTAMREDINCIMRIQKQTEESNSSFV